MGSAGLLIAFRDREMAVESRAECKACITPRIGAVAAIAAAAIVLTAVARGKAMEPARAVETARAYLACDDDAGRERWAAALAEYDGAIDPVLEQLSRRTFAPVEAGYQPEEHFSVRALRQAHPDDLLYFHVPEDYRPDTATGLIVFLHGGGPTSSRRAPRVFMNLPDEDDEAESDQLGDVFSSTGMVAVGPSAPWNERSSYRWCLRQCDDYLADVIRESKSRFNIDPDRVFLIGHSMGGFGAYHHALRQPDRFAAVVVNSGSWSLAYWPAIRGTPLCVVQGTRDARPEVRWHYTDVQYARWTNRLLTWEDLDHRYFEHDGEHAVHFGKKHIARFFESADRLRRDPYSRRVALASPQGFDESFCFPVRHNRWLTLDEAVDGDLEYDELVERDADDFDTWRLEHRKTARTGAAIEAVIAGDNVITVATTNVARCTIWLHPRMVAFSQPVNVVLNGGEPIVRQVEPSLLTALQSLERRGDWGLIYTARIDLDTDP